MKKIKEAGNEIMNGKKKSYNMVGPYSKSEIPEFQIDYRNLVKYARTKGISVVNLSDEEKNKFISGATMDDVRKAMIIV